MKNLFTIALLLFSFLSYAQEDTSEKGEKAEEEKKKKFSFSGSADVYYRTNINAPNGGDNHQTPNTSFANGNGFAIGMANAIIAYEGKKVGAVADLVFGPRGTDAVFGSLQWDIDGDGVNNESDECAFTALEDIVDERGCSLDQLTPCEGPRGTTETWRNHGKYVSSMAHATNNFLAAGLITEAEKDQIMSAAAESGCGTKK